MSAEEEQVHWNDVMRTLLSYDEFVAYDLARRQDRINKLPAKYADRLPDCTFAKFEALQHACSGNQVIFEDMVQFHCNSDFSSGRDANAKGPMKGGGPPIPLEQQHRNIAVLHSLYREWSKEGENERATTFKVLVDELKLRLPVTAENAYLQRVLVPGCGLGRLPLEIAAAGYACQGNEYSA
jgi:carnosine N-methyltransferase